MFVDLMNDVADTFTDRFLKVQLVIEEGPPAEPERDPSEFASPPVAPKKRYNAMGVLEDVIEPEPSPATPEDQTLEVGPGESPATKDPAVRKDPIVVGAGRPRSVSQLSAGPAAPTDWTNVGRNDPCPCGSGKKFKKCHGASL